MRKVLSAARSGGAQSLAGPALAASARRCAERLHEAARQLAACSPGSQEQSLKPGLLAWLGQAEGTCRSAGDEASNALASRSEEAWGAALMRLKSQLDALSESWRELGDRAMRACGEGVGVAVPQAVRESPIEVRSRERDADGASMVLVPGGGFVRGADDDDAELDEGPVRWEELVSFWIDRTEVTVARYQRCMKAGACTQPGTGASCNRGAPGQGEHPVNCVSWDQATAYCRWVGARLPTEAEWEKAARGPAGRKYPWGPEEPSCERAVFFDPVRGHGCGTHATFPVGSRPSGASPYGAQDMAGSVWEWAQEPYRADPTAGDGAPGSRAIRVLRGGGWGKDGQGSLRSTMRLRFAGANATPGTGFRCAMDAGADAGASTREGGS